MFIYKNKKDFKWQMEQYINTNHIEYIKKHLDFVNPEFCFTNGGYNTVNFNTAIDLIRNFKIDDLYYDFIEKKIINNHRKILKMVKSNKRLESFDNESVRTLSDWIYHGMINFKFIQLAMAYGMVVEVDKKLDISVFNDSSIMDQPIEMIHIPDVPIYIMLPLVLGSIQEEFSRFMIENEDKLVPQNVFIDKKCDKITVEFSSCFLFFPGQFSPTSASQAYRLNMVGLETVGDIINAADGNLRTTLITTFNLLNYINTSGDSNRSPFPVDWHRLEKKLNKTQFEPKKNEIKKQMDAIRRNSTIIIGSNYNREDWESSRNRQRESARARKKCDHQIPVRGHWRNALVGVGRNETRRIWIKEQIRNKHKPPREQGKKYKIV